MVLRPSGLQMETVECGSEARKQFPFDKDYHNLNHGSFGAVPTAIRDLQRRYQDASESRPDVFIRYDFPRLSSVSRQAIADYLSCPKQDIVFVPNATTGLNCILRNLVFSPHDVALHFSTIYGAIEKTLLYITEITPLTLHRIPLTHPLSDTAVLSLFQSALAAVRAAGKTPRLAVFDTVSAQPGARVPFEALIAACRSAGIYSVVDAAHCAGQLPVSLSALDPDFLVSNLHKWLYVPRPCAIMFVPKRNQHLIRTSLPTSHYLVPRHYGWINNPLPPPKEPMSEFEMNFEFGGTLDSTAYLVVPEALEWRRRVTWRGKKGEEAVVGYLLESARQAGQTVADALGTDVLENEEGTLGRCAFANVRLPLDCKKLTGGDEGEVNVGKVVDIARWMESVLVEEKGTFMGILFHAGSLWTRLSAQIYLTIEDWERAGLWLKEICKRVEGRTW